MSNRPPVPDRPWQRRAAGSLTALGLLMSAAVLFYAGSKDAANALAYSGRVVGVVFVVASLVEWGAALAVIDYWGTRALRYSGTAVLIGVGSVAVTDLMFLITQIQGRSYTAFLWLWIGLALWAAWAQSRRQRETQRLRTGAVRNGHQEPVGRDVRRSASESRPHIAPQEITPRSAFPCGAASPAPHPR